MTEVGIVLCRTPHPTWFRQGQVKQLDQDIVHLGLSPNRGDSSTCSSHLGYLHGKKKKVLLISLTGIFCISFCALSLSRCFCQAHGNCAVLTPAIAESRQRLTHKCGW